MTGKAGLVPWKRLYVKHPPPTASATAEPLPWPFRLHVAGYKYKITHTHTTSKDMFAWPDKEDHSINFRIR